MGNIDPFFKKSLRKGWGQSRYKHNSKGKWPETEQSCSSESAKQENGDDVPLLLRGEQQSGPGSMAGGLLAPERSRLSSPAKAISRHSL